MAIMKEQLLEQAKLLAEGPSGVDGFVIVVVDNDGEVLTAQEGAVVELVGALEIAKASLISGSYDEDEDDEELNS